MLEIKVIPTKVYPPRYWRSLIRIESCGKDGAMIVLPFWNSDLEFLLVWEKVDPQIRSMLEGLKADEYPKRLHAEVNLQTTDDYAVDIGKILFRAWEMR